MASNASPGGPGGRRSPRPCAEQQGGQHTTSHAVLLPAKQALQIHGNDGAQVQRPGVRRRVPRVQAAAVDAERRRWAARVGLH